MQHHRVDLDSVRDRLRYPNELMSFLRIARGSVIVDLGAGDGYTSMYLARETGPIGTVIAQTPPEWRDFSRPYLAARLREGPLEGITWTERPFDDPIPAEVRDVDLVMNVLTYHDTLYMDVDRDRMNRRVFEALKPGGRYVIVDHVARPEDGGTVGRTLHRISEALVVEEVLRAGFLQGPTSDILADPADDHTGVAWANPQPRTDRFIVSFRKPN